MTKDQDDDDDDFGHDKRHSSWTFAPAGVRRDLSLTSECSDVSAQLNTEGTYTQGFCARVAGTGAHLCVCVCVPVYTCAFVRVLT